MRQGICAKCGSGEVYVSEASGAQSGLTAGGGQLCLRIYKENRFIPDVHVLETEVYVCRSCGYFESYVRDAAALSKLDDCTNWRRVG
jgi:predicted nucleic-acid-binding Zn-ribbon protein